MLQHYFKQTAVLSVTLTYTFCVLPIPESKFTETWQCKAILWGKGDSGLSYSAIDDFQQVVFQRRKNAGSQFDRTKQSHKSLSH
jgi:hypothetical protein